MLGDGTIGRYIMLCQTEHSVFNILYGKCKDLDKACTDVLQSPKIKIDGGMNMEGT